MEEKNILRFAQLFRGNERSFGQFTPNAPSSRHSITVKETYTFDHYVNHLDGKKGLGLVPIMDDGFCWFGAIDIDAHGDAEDIDLIELERLVRELDYPLTVCRSKSGGAHLYLFGNEPLRATVVRKVLAKWAVQLGHGGCEIFPKQDVLPIEKDTGEQQLGNWINLCWFDAENPKCLRYTVEGGKQVDFEHFLDIAESRRITPAMLVEKGDGEHQEAPPCIQRMITDGVGKGHRNEAMYNMVIYLKQAFPETYRDRAFDMNGRIFTEPMSHAEAKKVINSAARRDYRYKCKEEPCKSLCRSFECVTRKYGITPEEKGELEMGKPPAFGPLEKYMTTPVRWVLYVDEVRLNLTTQQLMDFKAIREAVADNLTRLIPPMKNDRWQVILHGLMQNAKLIEAPEEATQEGALWARLQSFLAKADLDSKGDDPEDRDALAYGTPVVQIKDDRRVVYFRGQDFLEYLKKNRADEFKGSAVWVALKQRGCEHTKLRVNKMPLNVWYVAVDDLTRVEIKAKEVRSEF